LPIKIDLKSLLSQDRLEVIVKQPKLARRDFLRSKVQLGSATQEEALELEKSTEWFSKLPKNVLSESHCPVTG
jgi:hypothetical protein